jgi:hypothetical protein
MRRSRMTTIATIAAAVSFGARRLMKSTFRPDFDSNGMQIIWDHEFGFLNETLVLPRQVLLAAGFMALEWIPTDLFGTRDLRPTVASQQVRPARYEWPVSVGKPSTSLR